MLVTNLITFELIALFAPQLLKIDPFQTLMCRGGGLFNNYYIPDGRMTTNWEYVKIMILGSRERKELEIETGKTLEKYANIARDLFVRLQTSLNAGIFR